MAIIDYGTVQVYVMSDQLEVSFPYDREFGSFLGTLKGRWVPARKAWHLKAEASNKSLDEMVAAIEAHLLAKAPKNWAKVCDLLKTNGCVYSRHEIFPGLAGLRLTIPLGHPCHHYLKPVPNLSNNGVRWDVPAPQFKNEIVQDTVTRLLSEDEVKYHELLAPVEERTLTGFLEIGAAGIETFGLSEEALISVPMDFLMAADPAMAKTPLREIALTVVDVKVSTPEKVRVVLEYAPADEGYGHARSHLFLPKANKLDYAMAAGSEWIQRRG